jgi:hypothetical protein
MSPAHRKLKAEAPEHLVTGRVREVEPIVLPEDEAGRAIGKSGTWMRTERKASATRIEQGLEPLGPRWVLIGSSIFYEVAELRAWISRHAVPCGRTYFRGDGRPGEGGGR